jgi:hypothetical protein
MKPKFELSRIYSDGTKEPVQIVPLTEAMKAQMNRRGFFGAGLTAAAALTLLPSCEPCDAPEPKPDSDSGSGSSSDSRTCTCNHVGTCSCNTVCTCNKVCTCMAV